MEWVFSTAPRPLYTREGSPVRVVEEAGCAKGRSGRISRGDLLHLSRFEPRAVDPVVILYTYYAIRPPSQLCLMSRLRMSGDNLYSPSMHFWHGQGKHYLLLCCVSMRARSWNVCHEVAYPDGYLSLVSSQFHTNFRVIPAAKTVCFCAATVVTFCFIVSLLLSA
jgi:hypothetical protein